MIRYELVAFQNTDTNEVLAGIINDTRPQGQCIMHTGSEQYVSLGPVGRYRVRSVTLHSAWGNDTIRMVNGDLV